jgi:hypothetical protein
LKPYRANHFVSHLLSFVRRSNGRWLCLTRGQTCRKARSVFDIFDEKARVLLYCSRRGKLNFLLSFLTWKYVHTSFLPGKFLTHGKLLCGIVFLPAIFRLRGQRLQASFELSFLADFSAKGSRSLNNIDFSIRRLRSFTAERCYPLTFLWVGATNSWLLSFASDELRIYKGFPPSRSHSHFR